MVSIRNQGKSDLTILLREILMDNLGLYMIQRAKYSQVIAAAKSGLSSRTASRIDNQIHQPKQANRHWRTREDPLSVIWEPIILPLLQQSDGLTPIGIFDFLCEQHSDQFDPKTRRTLERRITAGDNYTAVLKK